MRLLVLKTTIKCGLKREREREKTESFYFCSVKKYDYCDHQNMKMHLVLYYSNPNRKPQCSGAKFFIELHKVYKSYCLSIFIVFHNYLTKRKFLKFAILFWKEVIWNIGILDLEVNWIVFNWISWYYRAWKHTSKDLTSPHLDYPHYTKGPTAIKRHTAHGIFHL